MTWLARSRGWWCAIPPGFDEPMSVDPERRVIFGPLDEGRPCAACDRRPTDDGHDACIANLPNVKNACCGHGHEEDAYAQFASGEVVRGADALDFFYEAAGAMSWFIEWLRRLRIWGDLQWW